MQLQSKAWLLLTLTIVLHLCISTPLLRRHQTPHPSLVKRSSLDDTPSVFDFPYKEWYDNASPTAQPFIFLGLLSILTFLFGFIGISASDFFCPNLATIANFLGLNESTAGVTFLAFGNGSPDVFSTFAALNNGTFGLAVGELIGAASFIVSVVVGSIALIRPFHVPRFAFLRDTLFFTLAVVLLIWVLHDGHLTIFESGAMVVLYLSYVAVVVLHSLYHRKPVTPVLSPYNPTLPNSRNNSPLLSPLPQDDDVQRANFSLLGAIEFRDVVNSLQRESRSPSPTPRETVSGDYFGAWHRRSISHDISSPVHPATSHGNRQRSASYTRHTSIGGARMARQLGLSPLPPSPTKTHSVESALERAIPNLTLQVPQLVTPVPKHGPQLQVPSHHGSPETPRVPTIHVIDPAGHDEPVSPGMPDLPRKGVRYRLRSVCQALFPTLQDFREKSWVGRGIGIFSVPAVLALTLTLPVVEGEPIREGAIALPSALDEPLQPTATPQSPYPFDPALPKEAVHIDTQVGSFSSSLCAAQCVLGPLFCVALIFGDSAQLQYLLLGTTLVGLAVAVAVINTATDGNDPYWRFVRCLAGFTCSMVWIAAIANEVVSVLLAIGEIMGLSEAIIGLTIFAIGNSLADLVANITVAQFAPAMAYAACFGGPLLNLLLGIGGSGTYGILVTRQHVNIHFSPTLWVSAGGLIIMLLATAIFVPLNGYLIDRRWAICLIGAYVGLMVVNVGVELKMGKS